MKNLTYEGALGVQGTLEESSDVCSSNEDLVVMVTNRQTRDRNHAPTAHLRFDWSRQILRQNDIPELVRGVSSKATQVCLCFLH